MCVLFIHLATSIISQIPVDYSPQLLFPNAITGVQCGFQFNILRRAVRVKCLTRGLLWPSTLVESEDRRFIEDQLREYMFPFKHALHRGLLASTYLGALDSFFTSRMRACLGGYGNETELDLDVVNITRQGVARRMSSLKEAGDILCRNVLKDQRAPENEVISISWESGGTKAIPAIYEQPV
jgi:hypothetical protein